MKWKSDAELTIHGNVDGLLVIPKIVECLDSLGKGGAGVEVIIRQNGNHDELRERYWDGGNGYWVTDMKVTELDTDECSVTKLSGSR
jgi:hypothetical protein